MKKFISPEPTVDYAHSALSICDASYPLPIFAKLSTFIRPYLIQSINQRRSFSRPGTSCQCETSMFAQALSDVFISFCRNSVSHEELGLILGAVQAFFQLSEALGNILWNIPLNIFREQFHSEISLLKAA